jgi:processive 1,2-diacylglycerol beta-glucosyltransferase
MEVYPVKNRNPRILILTAKFGDGHLQASRALKQSFLDQGIEDVKVIDLLKEAHPVLNGISRKLYITSTRTSNYGLDYYGWSYYFTRNNKYNRSWNRYFNYLGHKKLKEIIHEVQPDAIINVFPFGVAPEIAYDMDIPTFTVLTDYALHARWVHPRTDKYYVATNELKAELLTKDFENEQIEVTGIPIRAAFYNVSNTDNSYKKLLDPSKKTVMITAGAYGIMSELESMVNSLLSRADYQYAIVCGRNKKMESNLRETFAGYDHVHIFGFVENIQELMAAASCIVTKAGGLTISEALTLLLPVFIYKPLGGQEKENALFFQSRGIAKISSTLQELEEDIVSFLADDDSAKEMRMRMAALRKEHAAEHIAKDIVLTISNKMLQQV